MNVTERKKLLKDSIATAKIYRSLVKKIEDPKTKVSVPEGIALKSYLDVTEAFLQVQTELLEITSPKGESTQRFEESNGIWKYAWGYTNEYAPVNIDEEMEEGCGCPTCEGCCCDDPAVPCETKEEN